MNCRFDQMSFRSSVVLIKCCFDQMLFRSSAVWSSVVWTNVVSVKCRFDQVLFRSSVVWSSVVRSAVVVPWHTTTINNTLWKNFLKWQLKKRLLLWISLRFRDFCPKNKVIWHGTMSHLNTLVDVPMWYWSKPNESLYFCTVMCHLPRW